MKTQLEMIVFLLKANIIQLLEIGLHNSDENIKEVYGGEQGLVNLLDRYFHLLDEFNLMLKFEKENAKTRESEE